MKTCTYEECTNKLVARGLCGRHYQQWNKGQLADYAPPTGRGTITTCTHPGCDRPYSAKGFCGMHYRRHKDGIDMDQPAEIHTFGRTCTIEGCDRKHVAHGLCFTHNARRERGADIHAPILSRLHTDDLAERLNLYAPPGEPDECWEWTRSTNKGYGVFSVGNAKAREAHTVSWEIHNGQNIPAGMVVRHSCDNPPCVNPAHLLLGTHADNVADKVKRQRQSRGESHGNAILTPGDVLDIRRLYKLGVQQDEIAKRFGTKQANVSSIVLRKTWRHVA